jgi:uncharacterized protein YndB with AHSA1/START domain
MEDQMDRRFIARARIEIQAPLARIWNALVNPGIISEYMFGTQVISDWKIGSKITWQGEWKGKSYFDRGQILQIIEPKLLQFSHYSPLSGLPESPENTHIVTILLKEGENGMVVDLSQYNITSEEEMDHSRKNWEIILGNLKEFLETGKVSL